MSVAVYNYDETIHFGEKPMKFFGFYATGTGNTVKNAWFRSKQERQAYVNAVQDKAGQSGCARFISAMALFAVKGDEGAYFFAEHVANERFDPEEWENAKEVAEQL